MALAASGHFGWIKYATPAATSSTRPADAKTPGFAKPVYAAPSVSSTGSNTTSWRPNARCRCGRPSTRATSRPAACPLPPGAVPAPTTRTSTSFTRPPTSRWRTRTWRTRWATARFASGAADPLVGRAPFKAAAAIFEAGFASEDVAKGGCPGCPGRRREDRVANTSDAGALRRGKELVWSGADFGAFAATATCKWVPGRSLGSCTATRHTTTARGC